MKTLVIVFLSLALTSPARATVLLDVDRQSENANPGAGTELGTALRLLRDAVKREPNNARFKYWYGLALEQDGDNDGAAGMFRAAMDLDPEDADPHRALADMLSKSNRSRPEAISEYRAALRLNPDYPEARRGLGNAIVLTQTIAMLPVLVLAKTDAERRYIQSMHARAAASGIAELRKAIELRPTWSMPHHNLAGALKLFGDISGAMVEYRTACSLEPSNAQYCADARSAETSR
jgi:Flp pilus assembly protein TadD